MKSIFVLSEGTQPTERHSLLFVCILLAVVSGQWLNLGIIASIVLGLIVLTAGVGVMGAVIGIWKDRIKSLIVD